MGWRVEDGGVEAREGGREQVPAEGIFGEIRENSGTGGMVAWADGRGGGAI